MTEGEVRKFLSLKGQMLYMEEWESICFLGIPVMLDLHQMFKTGVSHHASFLCSLYGKISSRQETHKVEKS